MARLHATCVALSTAAGPLAVLLRGAAESGKSDLALRLIDAGAWLIADDQVEVERRGRSLIARAPDALAGALEVRGFGISEMPHLASAPLALAVELRPAGEIERLPEPASLEIEGLTLPLIAVDPRAASAPARLRLALRRRAAALALPPARSGPPPADARSEPGPPRPVVLVTGLSGAGRTAALKILEDIGYEAIDNLPLNLLGRAVAEGELPGPVAIGADIRNRSFAPEPFLRQLDRLVADPGLQVSLLFLDCDDEVLQRRFTETRRRHPLAQDRPLADGIAAERRLLAPLRERADRVVDTTQISPTELRRLLSGQLALAESPRMGLFVASFSYRRGLPREADLVIDARFLRNPHYVDALRPLTGSDAAVGAYVAEDAAFAPFLENLQRWLAPLLPLYEDQGKKYLTIAVGCTGGRHRSVFIAETLARWLAEIGRPAVLAHRELEAAGERDVPAAPD